MAMMEMYPQIRMGHIGLVQLTGAFMAIRYGLALFGSTGQRHMIMRGIAWTIDALLLTFAAMLFTMLPHSMFANGWIWIKLLFVVAYFGFGYAGLGANKSRGRVAVFAVLTFACYFIAYGIARAHDARGWLLLLGS